METINIKCTVLVKEEDAEESWQDIWRQLEPHWESISEHGARVNFEITAESFIFQPQKMRYGKEWFEKGVKSCFHHILGQRNPAMNNSNLEKIAENWPWDHDAHTGPVVDNRKARVYTEKERTTVRRPYLVFWQDPYNLSARLVNAGLVYAESDEEAKDKGAKLFGEGNHLARSYDILVKAWGNIREDWRLYDE